MNGKFHVVAAGLALLVCVQSSSAFWRDNETAGNKATRHAQSKSKTSSARASAVDQSDLMGEIEQLQKAFAFLREDREVLRKDIKDLRAENKTLDREADRLKELLKKSEAEVEKAQRELMTKKRARGTSDRNIRQSKAKVKELTAELKEERRKSSTFELRSDQLESELIAARAALVKRDQEISQRQAVADKRRQVQRRPDPRPEPKPRREPTPRRDPVVVEQAVAEIDMTAFEQPKTVEVVATSGATTAAGYVVEGNSLLALGSVDKARANFLEALKLNPGSQSALMGLAACSYTAGHLDEAETIVSGLLRTDAANADALGLQGMIMWREGLVEQATVTLEQALDLDEKNAQLHNYMGIMNHAQDDLSGAAREFDKAVELDPQHLEARFNLAVVLATSVPPRIEQAREHYEKALRLGTERNEALEEILYP